MAQEQDVHEQEQGMTSQIGPIEIDWPRTIGYYGGVGLAVAFQVRNGRSGMTSRTSAK
jgi:hypothetical protein